MPKHTHSHPAPPPRLDPAAAGAIVARIPEGFIAIETLAQRLGIRVGTLRIYLEQPETQVRISPQGSLVYDSARLTLHDALAQRADRQPAFPSPAALSQPPIAEQLAARAESLTANPELIAVMDRLAPAGYLAFADLTVSPSSAAALQTLLDRKMLARSEDVVYDPLRLSPQSAARLSEQWRLGPLQEQLQAWLAGQPGQTTRREEFYNRAGQPKDAEALLARSGVFVAYRVTTGRGHDSAWVRLTHAPAAEAIRAAEARLAEVENTQWEACRQACGDVLRPEARDGQAAHIQVVARSYLLPAAAKRLELARSVIEEAARQGAVPRFSDPAGQTRLPAAAVEAAVQSEAEWEKIAAFERLTIRDIALVSGLAYNTVRHRLEKAGISRTEPRWGQVRGQWGLPDTLRAFKAICAPRRQAWLAEILAEKQHAEDHRFAASQEAKAAERRQREELRQRLLTVFPAWDAGARAGQTLFLHLGPTNSGKTYEALRHLVEAGRGWYLAPLRLLAHEVFETLNRSGTRCNLLTGEESIPVPGAEITASTIEMFSPSRSEGCTVIDEAHMLADEQRGWAWTRALMESLSPDLHVIGAPVAGPLVKRLAEAAGITLFTIEHQRLTPLAVAPRPWSLAHLPPKTILVAFSRAMVLGLKSELERNYRRRVSVIYGDLPPEVRRSQAARFAAGETEICVATDAVGMGLNLPADHVCFFEVQKFDGRERRVLTPNELRQIGGRAGRFGLSQTGLVGALQPGDLEIVRRGFGADGQALEFARVAPSPEALALLPGTLAQRLRQWMELKSIPDNWRLLLKPVDVTDAIELAEMLSPHDVAALGDEKALQLVRAPSDRNTRIFWHQCARAIIHQSAMPVPPETAAIRTARDLEAAENRIQCADVYLWLAQRSEFAGAGPDAEAVRAARAQASREVDAALKRRIDTARRCQQCGRPLPPTHRFPICDACHQSRWRDNAERWV